MKYVITNCIILDGTKDMKPIEGHRIFVEDGKITTIKKISYDKSEDLSGYEIVDLKGQYILPGLINLHVHLAGSGKPKKKASDPKKLVALITKNALTNTLGHALVAKYAKTQLLSGTTTIRTVGGIKDYDSLIRDEINSGKRVGPRILASNMAISVPNGHMAGSLGYEALSPQDGVKYVDVIAKDKPDLIKLMITGGVMDAEVVGEPGVLRMQPEIVKAVCDRAHELGFKVAAHVESPEGVRVALENGVDSIEHGAKPSDEIIELFKNNKAFQVSTISPALPYALFDREISHATYEQNENGKIVFNGIIELAKSLIKEGVPVGLGTDTACPYVTHYDTWRELFYFIKYCDVSNAFAIHSATLLNANLAGIGDETGSIEVGKSADMIVVKDNPLKDITTLRHVTKVFMRGTIINNPKVKKIKEVETELDKFL